MAEAQKVLTLADAFSELLRKQYARFINALKQHKILIILLLLALLTRWILLDIYARLNVAEGWDALGYFIRAIGVENALSDLVQGNLPATEDLAAAYTSTWPPLQTILLGIGRLLFGSDLEGARLTMVLVSAITTPLVYLVTRDLAGRRAALMASIVFVFYPTFLHYSLRLFSETTYIFLVFLALFFVLKIVNNTQETNNKSVYATLLGITLGLATLTRSAGLVWIPTVAIWLFWQLGNQKKRLVIPAIVIFSAGVTILPWELALFAVEDRVTIITTTGDYNLYMGNNPVAELGKEESKLFAQTYSNNNGISLLEAYRTLAVQTIINDPIGFVHRGLRKWQKLWSTDNLFFVHMYSATFPPLRNNHIILLTLAMVFGFFIYIALAVKGLLSQAPTLKHRSLIAVLIGVAMMMHFLTVASTRFNVPLQAVLLPAVGLGLAHWKAMSKQIISGSTLVMVISIVLIWMTVYRSLPFNFQSLIASSHYGEAVSQIGRWIGSQPTVGDRLLFRKTDDEHNKNFLLKTSNPNFEFTEIVPNFLTRNEVTEIDSLLQNTESYNWNPANKKEILSVVIKSKRANQDLKLELSSNQLGVAEELVLTENAWQTWQRPSLPGIEYMWVASPLLKKAAVKRLLEIKGLI